MSILHLPVAVALTEFSAEVQYYNQQQKQLTIHGSLYVSDDVIREEFNRDGKVEVKITDLFRGTTSMLDLERKEYQRVAEVFTIPRNPAQFCAEMALLECGFKGYEEIEGVKTERWGADLGFGSLSVDVVAWYDPSIQYPLRIKLGNGNVLQLSRVEKRRIPSSLLSVPFGFNEVDQLKHPQGDYFSVWP
ncbi:MAG TPA: hypothetical protein HPP65_02840 [Gammaproteobacteria bacterium]|nr:hypothetical protein [Gammaproteobacteria bacterium]MBT4549327.1 hypothetical protein [Gammaproteobacteria bacterium]MBT6652445.1 hypothetical protein [Gammaproteobacteria bacterium]MBT7327136.1 hypothetical protein [Gammaproteobacteria bacterium]HIJ23877.1 hypothetical protein [Gammaproteobacteria bacterium]